MKLGKSVQDGFENEMRSIPKGLQDSMDINKVDNPHFSNENKMIQAFRRMILYLGNISKIIRNP